MIAQHLCLATRKITSFGMGSSVLDPGTAAFFRVRLRRNQPAEFAAIAALAIVLMAGNNVGSIERDAGLSTCVPPEVCNSRIPAPGGTFQVLPQL